MLTTVALRRRLKGTVAILSPAHVLRIFHVCSHVEIGVKENRTPTWAGSATQKTNFVQKHLVMCQKPFRLASLPTRPFETPLFWSVKRKQSAPTLPHAQNVQPTAHASTRTPSPLSLFTSLSLLRPRRHAHGPFRTPFHCHAPSNCHAPSIHH